MMVMFRVAQHTPYTTALYNIGLEEQQGKLDPGSYDEAFRLMLHDTFDESLWARRYLPRQTGE
jgi:hypothetical protein